MSCLSLAASDSGVCEDDDDDVAETVDTCFSMSFRLMLMDGEGVLSTSSGVGERCLGAMLL